MFGASGHCMHYLYYTHTGINTLQICPSLPSFHPVSFLQTNRSHRYSFVPTRGAAPPYEYAFSWNPTSALRSQTSDRIILFEVTDVCCYSLMPALPPSSRQKKWCPASPLPRALPIDGTSRAQKFAAGIKQFWGKPFRPDGTSPMTRSCHFPPVCTQGIYMLTSLLCRPMSETPHPSPHSEIASQTIMSFSQGKPPVLFLDGHPNRFMISSFFDSTISLDCCSYPI